MHTLSVVIPCYNEAKTLESCVKRVLELKKDLELQIIIVDDASQDNSIEVAHGIINKYPECELYTHPKNLGKGAALRTGFSHAKGDFTAIQDADLEYNPIELRMLLEPLIDGRADVVYGSRFMSGRPHRVLYYWHSLGNKFLTMLSNMFTDLNLTDMETCYKVFRTDIIRNIPIEENRFGFEPEITAKIAQQHCRIYELGISYEGRTYEEGKKIGWKDGFRTLYCIFKYNAPKAPLPVQLLIYLVIGGISAIVNLLIFMALYSNEVSINIAAPVAFISAAYINYLIATRFLFRSHVRWGKFSQLALYLLVVILVGTADLYLTRYFIHGGFAPVWSKLFATASAFLLNFLSRKYIIFPERH
ncbi:bifunctional glycosyltransferase family 2/GtrA family protein [Fulvivirga sedimenti]|uniref:bifunctional glycosyltransferase family 2/GtrA family protein n=1 Tax=Fulvivirga sedimenti TaxID=2879465 RepID=UPI0030841033